MKSVTLNNGVEMPILGFGVFQVLDPAECERSVLDAIATGYRLLDTAASYGNEEAVGQAIKKRGLLREDLFITTKLWIQSDGYEGAKKLLGSIGAKYDKSIAQVILRWLTQRGVVAIPKSVRQERMAENFNSLDFELSADDMEAVPALDTKTSLFFNHRDPAMVKWLGERKLDS